RKGPLLFVTCNNFKRTITFYQKDPSSTAKELEKVLGEIKVDDITKSFALTKLAELYQVATIEAEKGIYSCSYECDGVLAEECYNSKNVFWLVYDSQKNEIKKVEGKLELGEKIIFPIFNKDVETHQVLLPSEALDYGDDSKLFDEIKAFLNKWHEEPNERDRIIDVLYIFMTWIYDVLPELPYLRALAPLGKGKSTKIQAVGSICYRPMFLAGVNSEADLKRTFDLYRGTAIIDEADFSKSDLFASIIKILNIGYSNTFGWYRCRDKEDPDKGESFRVFGPKLLATRERYKDTAIESRCITTKTEENRNPMPLYRAKKFLDEALELRNKLLAWRFKNYYRIKRFVEEKFEDP
ncbi:MAG: hypothetical protein ACPLYF_02245, partial [Fervidobacterium sp.]